MSGYVGVRAKRRTRNIILLLLLLVFLALGIKIIPKFKLNEIIPPGPLLPSDEEITTSQVNTTIEELELKVFDKEQKIIFSNKQIEKLKTELKNLLAENEILYKSSLDFNNQITLAENQTSEVESINSEIKKIKQDANKKLKKLNNIIINITNEKKVLLKNKDETESENNLLKKEYKSFVSKNLKLNNVKDDFQNKINELTNKIIELENLIEEKNLIIKILEDTSHHD